MQHRRGRARRRRRPAPDPLRGGEHGKVLYRGPASVCAAGTTAEWGFGFRAFPFAGLVPRRFCMRIYAGHALEATMRMGALWRGEHPMPEDAHLAARPVAARCSRARCRSSSAATASATRIDVEYSLAQEQVDVLDWRAWRAERASGRALDRADHQIGDRAHGAGSSASCWLPGWESVPRMVLNTPARAELRERVARAGRGGWRRRAPAVAPAAR